MGTIKKAAAQSPIGRGPFLCEKEVTRPVEGVCEGDCMTIQGSDKKEVSASWLARFYIKELSMLST